MVRQYRVVWVDFNGEEHTIILSAIDKSQVRRKLTQKFGDKYNRIKDMEVLERGKVVNGRVGF